MKKKLLIYLTAFVMCFGCAFPSFAVSSEDNNNGNIQINDCDVATEMQEVNANGILVNIKIDENVIGEIKGDDIAEILNNGLGTISEDVEIISSKSIQEDGMEPVEADSYYIFTNDKKMVGVNVPDDISISDSNLLLDLVEDENVGDRDIVTLQGISEAVDDVNRLDSDDNAVLGMNPEIETGFANLENEGISPAALLYYIKTSKATKFGSEYVCKDKFIISVAKGEIVKLGKDFSVSVKTTLSAGSEYFDLAEMKAGLTATVTCKISKTTIYDAKDMAKGKNSREFRVKYYKQKYKRTQKKYRKLTDKLLDTKTSTIEKPTKYLKYSIDRYVR